MHLIFFENRSEVSAVRESLPIGPEVKFIAVTAEAAQYFDELKIAYEPVSKYADTRKMGLSIQDQLIVDSFHLAEEIESFIAQHHPKSRFRNPAFLTSLSHYIFYSVHIVLSRAFMLRETIMACLPDVVTVFNAGVDHWFSDSGYEQQPWYDVIDDLSKQHEFRFEVRFLAEPYTVGDKESEIQANHHFMARCKSILRKSIFIKKILAKKRLLNNAFPLNGMDGLHDLQGIRVLMVQSYQYDWLPVLSGLQSVKDTDCIFIEGTSIEPYPWAYYYEPYAYSLWKTSVHKFKIDPPSVDEEEKQLLSELFNRWIETRSESPDLTIMGMNLFPSLVNHLKTMVAVGLALSRYTDALTSQVLDKIKPHIVCFVGMINLSEKRFAFQCRKRNIPVVCYQHGGGFGVIHCAKDEQTEVAHADYFLTHGNRICPRKEPAFPVRAEYIPVGSSRIEAMNCLSPLKKAKSAEMINVLWIAETSTRNQLDMVIALEDTERYLIQQRGLEILAGAKNIRVIFRPEPVTIDFEGTNRWLNSSRYPSISVDVKQPLEELICECDVVVSSTASPTTWEEVIGLKKPMILFTKTPMECYAESFIQDLDKSTYWCKSEDALFRALNRLVSEGMDFVSELRQIDTADFIRNYVLYRDDGKCVQRVLSFLKEIYQKDGGFPQSML